MHDFTSCSTVFQSYQDAERLIMKGCVQWKPVYGLKISPRERIKPYRQISRPATGAPILFRMPLLIKFLWFFPDPVAGGSAFSLSLGTGWLTEK